MILRDKIIFWLLGLVAFFWFLGSISSILSPFILAIIIAYFLNPLANRLEQYKFSRTLATLTIVFLSISIIVIFFILIIPILYKELIGLINAVPRYYEIFLLEFYPKIIATLKDFGYKDEIDFVTYLNQENLTKIFSFSDNIVSSVMKSSIAIVNILSLIFITPILVFYLLKDWNLLIKNLNNHLPPQYSSKIREVFTRIDYTLSGFIIGQFNVCCILGIFYAIGLTIVGLNFGFLIGFLTGIMSFIPYVGMLIGVVVAIIIALFQWGFDISQIGLVTIIFIIGQILESNFLTPKLVGKRIGLHPVLVIFSVFAFGILFGFFGILLAVPMAAVLGVVLSFIAQEYKKKFIK